MMNLHHDTTGVAGSWNDALLRGLGVQVAGSATFVVTGDHAGASTLPSPVTSGTVAQRLHGSHMAHHYCRLSELALKDSCMLQAWWLYLVAVVGLVIIVRGCLPFSLFFPPLLPSLAAPLGLRPLPSLPLPVCLLSPDILLLQQHAKGFHTVPLSSLAMLLRSVPLPASCHADGELPWQHTSWCEDAVKPSSKTYRSLFQLSLRALRLWHALRAQFL